MINLLEQRAKAATDALYVRALVRALVTLITLVCALALVPHVPLYLSVLGEERDTLANLAIVKERADTLAKQTSATTSKAAEEQVKFGKAYTRTPSLERAVGALVTSLPAGVTVYSVSAKYSGARVEVSAKGQAPTRDSLTKLEGALRAAANVSDVKIPVAAFVEEREREFTITYAFTSN